MTVVAPDFPRGAGRFAKQLADSFAVMDRGEIVLAGDMDKVPEKDIKKHLTV